VGPLIGGVIGVLVYDWFIGDVLHARDRLARPPEPGRTREPGMPEAGQARGEAPA
jgi:glycerol uptake facilitator protein